MTKHKADSKLINEETTKKAKTSASGSSSGQPAVERTVVTADIRRLLLIFGSDWAARMMSGYLTAAEVYARLGVTCRTLNDITTTKYKDQPMIWKRRCRQSLVFQAGQSLVSEDATRQGSSVSLTSLPPSPPNSTWASVYERRIKAYQGTLRVFSEIATRYHDPGQWSANQKRALHVAASMIAADADSDPRALRIKTFRLNRSDGTTATAATLALGIALCSKREFVNVLVMNAMELKWMKSQILLKATQAGADFIDQENRITVKKPDGSSWSVVVLWLPQHLNDLERVTGMWILDGPFLIGPRVLSVVYERETTMIFELRTTVDGAANAHQDAAIDVTTTDRLASTV